MTDFDPASIFFVTMLPGQWDRRQQKVIDPVIEEKRALPAKLEGNRLR